MRHGLVGQSAKALWLRSALLSPLNRFRIAGQAIRLGSTYGSARSKGTDRSTAKEGAVD